MSGWPFLGAESASEGLGGCEVGVEERQGEEPEGLE